MNEEKMDMNTCSTRMRMGIWDIQKSYVHVCENGDFVVFMKNYENGDFVVFMRDYENGDFVIFSVIEELHIHVHVISALMLYTCTCTCTCIYL